MANTTQSKRDWIGGINQMIDRSKIDFQREYGLLINGRVRDNTVTPVIGPADITQGLPTEETVQGIYGIGQFLLVFAGGLAFYKNYTDATPVWTQIGGFSMSATAAKIWACAVPSSSVNFVRTATDVNNIKAPVALTGTRQSSPQAIICMDGETQPWLIFSDGTSRVTKTFNEWTVDDAEYVPIARMPFYYNGILYCIGQDLRGVYNQIYRSVTGRPCDFLIIVDQNGNKNGTELERGAPALAERVDFAEVTSIGAINSVDGSFLVTTAQNSYTVTPDYNSLIASEPTFIKQFLFNVGAVNDTSVTDVLGDTTVIHSRGIRSFNGVNQVKFQGKYSPFNIRINKLIDSKIQQISACTTWENYAVYALETVHGYGILWYDMLLSQWVSLDLYEEQTAIKQFAIVTVGTVNKLFMLASDGRVFELFAGVRQKCEVQLADILPGDDAYLHSLQSVSTLFSYGTTEGHAEITYKLDGRYIGSLTARLISQHVAYTAGVEPIQGALALSTDDTLPLIFYCRSMRALGARISVGITWNTDAKLVEATVSTEVQGPRNKPGTEGFAVQPLKIIFLGSDARMNEDSAAINLAIKRENADYVIGLGSHTFTGTAEDVQLRLAGHWNSLHNNGTFYAVPGPSELDSSVGEPFFQYVRQDPSRYSILHTSCANFYLFNSGFDSAGTQVEPDNSPSIAAGAQLRWFQGQDSDKPFNFMVMGTPARSSTAAQRAALDAIPFAGLGMDAVLSGLGGYERLEDPQRITFFNVGTGGNEIPQFSTVRADSAVRIDQYGYLRLTLTPLSALFEFVSQSGEILDRRLL